MRRAGHTGVFPPGNNLQHHCFLIWRIMNNTVIQFALFLSVELSLCCQALDLLILQGVWRNIGITLAFGLFVSKEMFELSYLTKRKQAWQSQWLFLTLKGRKRKDEGGNKIGFYSVVFQLMIQNTNDFGGKVLHNKQKLQTNNGTIFIISLIALPCKYHQSSWLE